MKPRLVLKRDPFRPIAIVHEAAHAVVAYHLRFPYSHVEIKITGFGRCEGGGLFPDQHAAALAIGQVKPEGEQYENRAGTVLGAVLRIARRANALINAGDPAATEAELDHYASGDLKDEDNYLAKYADARKDAIRLAITQEVNRIILIPIFRDAVEDIVPLLNRKRRLTCDEVRDVIEAELGTALRHVAPEPAHADIDNLAARLSKHPALQGKILDHWITAERALRFAMAIRHDVQAAAAP